ncbi:unnamed protein product (macronuclear) [Paramecium tetraurelia]|uniref:Chromosome undetermined scaffold_1, whole genome shotgun sequence n=1 Tax=Paramecium tetraurelia TaxID=5888 RepID=Q6BGA0_PARTE|nr:hypothetical protein [Paramecium tetraurelia strain d4-2]XP_001423380.1 uncharacterized protein GSPATT00000417001 [Paramecium tetraurelia]CAH03320.1 hypothetical protein with coiled-coil domain [Paramecium tetraurelia]CAK55982.1 unnamed protein product [Paramecium tetraurelia]|eukprot:XP_001423380.1 hypothetical protein (macronuclear) [Paramecium tetraurelia strain d4-2]
MNSNDNNFCLSHKAREEFVCVNSLCIDKQKKLSCYKCLEAQHIHQHNPREDFKSIYTIVEQINLEKEERLIILRNAKQWSINQKKENRQALEKSKLFSPQFINEMSSKIDEQYEECCHKINYLQICLEDVNPITPYSLPTLIRFYKQSTKEFSEEVEIVKFKSFGSSQLSQRQSDTALIETLKKMQDQVKALEQKVDQLSTQNHVQLGKNHYYPAIIISLITIIIIQFFSPQSKFQIEIQEKFEEAYSECKNFNSEINQKFQEANNELQKLNSQHKSIIDQKFESYKNQVNNAQMDLENNYFDLRGQTDNNQLAFESLKSQLNNFNLKLNELESQTKKILDIFNERAQKFHHHDPNMRHFKQRFHDWA